MNFANRTNGADGVDFDLPSEPPRRRRLGDGYLWTRTCEWPRTWPHALLPLAQRGKLAVS
jgi:hypothetical protein